MLQRAVVSPGCLRSHASADGAVRRRMQHQGMRDTAPELALRRAVHALGLRYRVDRAPLPGLRRRADLVFGPAQVAVFVDGCFWHSCPEHGNAPRANSARWAAKLARNTARDADTDARLAAAGWTVLRLWEHEDPRAGAARVADAVHGARGGQLRAPVRAGTGEHGQGTARCG